MGSVNRSEEPLSFEAREFIREKYIGKKCEFEVEYTVSNRQYGILIIGEIIMNLELVRNGLAKVMEKKGNM